MLVLVIAEHWSIYGITGFFNYHVLTFDRSSLPVF